MRFHVYAASFPLKLEIFVKEERCKKLGLRVDRGLLYTRATRVYSPLCMKTTMATKKEEREREMCLHDERE